MIVTEELVVDGTIAMEGQSGESCCRHPSKFCYNSGDGSYCRGGAGGAGGSIYITTDVLKGSGLISVNGGRGGFGHSWNYGGSAIRL